MSRVTSWLAKTLSTLFGIFLLFPGYINPDKSGILVKNDIAIVKFDRELPDVHLIPKLPTRFLPQSCIVCLFLSVFWAALANWQYK